jgi:FixJ family two-component response regulator
MNRKHIVLVDDDLNLLRSLEFILEAADFRVTTGRSGKEGLEKILAAQTQPQAPDLLITDVQMPGLTGVQLIDELRRLNIFIPTLVITAYGDRKLKDELTRRDCTHTLDKPFNEEKLLQNVLTILKIDMRLE